MCTRRMKQIRRRVRRQGLENLAMTWNSCRSWFVRRAWRYCPTGWAPASPQEGKMGMTCSSSNGCVQYKRPWTEDLGVFPGTHQNLSRHDHHLVFDRLETSPLRDAVGYQLADASRTCWSRFIYLQSSLQSFRAFCELLQAWLTSDNTPYPCHFVHSLRTILQHVNLAP